MRLTSPNTNLISTMIVPYFQLKIKGILYQADDNVQSSFIIEMKTIGLKLTSKE